MGHRLWLEDQSRAEPLPLLVRVVQIHGSSKHGCLLGDACRELLRHQLENLILGSHFGPRLVSRRSVVFFLKFHKLSNRLLYFGALFGKLSKDVVPFVGVTESFSGATARSSPSLLIL